MNTNKTKVHAYLINRGRVFVESISGSVAVVRFDCNDGTRSRCHTVVTSEIDFAREWKF